MAGKQLYQMLKLSIQADKPLLLQKSSHFLEQKETLLVYNNILLETKDTLIRLNT